MMRTVLPLLMSIGCAACSSSSASQGSPTAASASAAPPMAIGLNMTADKVEAVVNPGHDPVYKGPFGRITGRVTVKGDPPPDAAYSFPPVKCAEAQATYGKLFRVAGDGAVADAVVTATGYTGKFVPEKKETVTLTIHGCAYNTRTVVLTYGQRLEVQNNDPIESYVPFLDGSKQRAAMVAIAKGSPVRLYPDRVGRYLLRDEMPHTFLLADVLVLKFPTHAVTGLDGKYVIEDVPIGKLHVDAFLPAIARRAGKDIDVHEGDNTLDIELDFDAKRDTPGMHAQIDPQGAASAAAASAEASAPPAPSAPSSAGAASSAPATATNKP
jgi:hypothetical protein